MDGIGSFDDFYFKVKIKGIERPVFVFIQVKYKDDINSFVDFDDAISFQDSYLKFQQKFNGTAETEDKIFNGKFDENECIFILYTNAKHNHDSGVQFNGAYASVLNDLLATGKDGTHLKCTDKITEKAVETIFKQETVSSSKHSGDFTEMAKEILHKYVIYAKQSGPNEIEKALIKQIELYYSNSNVQNQQVQPEAIYLNYHGAVRSWWLLKDKTPYLTKQTLIYHDAMNNILHEPLMSKIKNAFNLTKLINIEYTRQALETLQLREQTNETDGLALFEKTVIVTEVTTLTTIKVMQYLSYKGIKNYTPLDLSYTINVSIDEFCALKRELKNTDKYIIVICENLQSGVTGFEKYLKEIAQVIEKKHTVVITNSMFVDMVLNVISPNKKEIIKHEHTKHIFYENHSLVDFTQDSQKYISKNRKIIFQGQLIDLGLLLDDTSSVFIEGLVLNKIVFNETIELGEPLSDPNYDQISHLCMERVVEYKKCQLVPGKISICATDCIIGENPSYYQEDNHRDSLYSINLLEDPNNYTCNSCEAPLSIDFHFGCRVNLKMIIEYFEILITSKKADKISYRVSLKKDHIQNKIWVVKVTLSNCTELFKKWQEDKRTDKTTLKMLRNLCEYILDDYIIHNESPEIRKTMGTLNTQTINKLFDETNISQHTANQVFAVAGTSRNIEKPISHDASDDKFNNGTMQDRPENFDENALNLAQLKSSGVNTVFLQTSNDLDDVKLISEALTIKFYSIVRNVIITTYEDESDDIAVAVKKTNNDNSIQKKIIALPWHHKQSDPGYAHNFQINYNYIHKMNVEKFDDIQNNVVLLTAEAGVGKSTLLTHLYKKQNKVLDNNWILKIKLINYSGNFRKWQENKNIVIDKLETLKFLSQIVTKNKNITVELKESCNKVFLENCSGNVWDRFNLNMFLHYYNEGKLLLLFDGFDEICPDYKDEVIKFLQVVKNFPQRNKMWITSRPYNSILPDLEQHFGNSFMLTCFDRTEQSQYLYNFWTKHFDFKTLDKSSIEAHVSFVANVMPFLDNILKLICYDYYKFILTNSLTVIIDQLQESAMFQSSCKKIEEDTLTHTSVFSLSISEICEFLSTPLLLHLSALHFVSQIPYKVRMNPENFNIITMYKQFIEIKLRYILFVEKCGLNVDIPYINEACQSELEQCIAIHKKLGAHAILGSPLFTRFRVYIDEFREMSPFNLETEAGRHEFNSLIDRIMVGGVRTGLISHVTSEYVPVFVHKTFAQFFAFEYVYDILKTQEIDYMKRKRLLCAVTIHTGFDDINDYGYSMLTMGRNMGHWLSQKCLLDPELKIIVGDLRRELPLMTESFNTKYRKFFGPRHMKNT